MHTVMYQIWVKEGKGAELSRVWGQYGKLLGELGVERAWVIESELGRCDAYLSWRERALWEQASRYCDLMDGIGSEMAGDLLGWLSPVVVPVDALPVLSEGRPDSAEMHRS